MARGRPGHTPDHTGANALTPPGQPDDLARRRLRDLTFRDENATAKGINLAFLTGLPDAFAAALCGPIYSGARITTALTEPPI